MIDYIGMLRQRGLVLMNKGSGDNMFMTCVFHGDTDPSLEVNVHDGRWFCFGCRAGGGFAKLIAEIDGISIEAAKSLLKGNFDLDSIVGNYDTFDQHDSDVDRFYSKKSFLSVFPAIDGTPGEQYVESRGLSRQFARSRMLRWGIQGVWRDRVIMPILTPEGKLVSYAGRAIYEKMIPKVRNSTSRIKNYFYGIRELIKDVCHLSVLIVVEGYFDALYLQQFGYPAIANNGVARISAQKMSVLCRYTKKVILSFDGDEAGRKATEQWESDLRGYIPVKSVRIPDGKDPAVLTRGEIDGIYGGVDEFQADR